MFLLLCFGAVVSCFSLTSFIFFSFLLFERALFLVEPSDSFGSQVYLRVVVALWDESLFRLVL